MEDGRDERRRKEAGRALTDHQVQQDKGDWRLGACRPNMGMGRRSPEKGSTKSLESG